MKLVKHINLVLLVSISSILMGQNIIDDRKQLGFDTIHPGYSLISYDFSKNIGIYVKPCAQDVFFSIDSIIKYSLSLQLVKNNDKWEMSKYRLIIKYSSGQQVSYGNVLCNDQDINKLPTVLRNFFENADFIIDNYFENDISFNCIIEIPKHR